MKENKTIAIQGEPGSFHHQAAQQYFGDDAQTLSCKSFKELVAKAGDKTICDGGIIAIENSIAGSILKNYTLVQESGVHVTGEIYLTIEQHLLINKGVSLNDIKTVSSHPMALLQCDIFLEKFRWQQIEASDTASAAKELSISKSRTNAVIASSASAALYDLEILTSNIQTESKNYTRFLAVTARPHENLSQCNKASVYFILKSKIGSLASALSLLQAHSLNLTKIQSFPILGSVWEYGFYVDIEFEDISQLNDGIHNLTFIVEKIQTYGIYRKGVTV